MVFGIFQSHQVAQQGFHLNDYELLTQYFLHFLNEQPKQVLYLPNFLQNHQLMKEEKIPPLFYLDSQLEQQQQLWQIFLFPRSRDHFHCNLRQILLFLSLDFLLNSTQHFPYLESVYYILK